MYVSGFWMLTYLTREGPGAGGGGGRGGGGK